jgi:hypothetical protein
VIRARSVKPGALSNCRKAKRTSVIIGSIMEFGCSEGVTWIQPRADLLQPPCHARTSGAND